MAELTLAEEGKKRLSDVTAKLAKKEAELTFNRSEEGKKLNSLLAATDKRLKQESAKVDTEEAILATKEAILATERDIDELSTQRGRKLIQLEKDLEKAQVKRAKREKKIGRDAGVVGKELLESLNPLKGLGKALEGIVPKPLLLAGELLGKGIGAAARGMGSLAGKGIRAGGRGIMGLSRKTSAGGGVEPETPEVIPETSAVGRKRTKLDPKAFLLTSKTQPLYEEEGKTPEAVPTEPAVGKKPGFFGRLFAEPEEAEEEKIIGKATVLEGTNELIKLAEERNKILERIFNRLPKPADASEEREEDIEEKEDKADIIVIGKEKKKGGWFSKLLSGGMGKMVKWAAAFGAMLLPLIGYAAVAAILAGGGILISNWVKKNWGADADKTMTDIEKNNLEYAAHIQEVTQGAATLTEAAGVTASVVQDLPGVEKKLAEKGIKLQNDWLENWTGDLTAGVLTAVRRSGEIQEETQLVANQIFREGIDDVTGQLERGELGEKGLGELQGIIQQANMSMAKGANLIAREFGIENLTGMWELGVEDQVHILGLLKEQMLLNDVDLQKTVDQMNTVALKTLQEGTEEERALAVQIAEAIGERIAKEAFKKDTTNVEEKRIKEIHDKFRELIPALSAGDEVAAANEKATRYALERMLETGEINAEELGLLMKNEDAWGLHNFSEDQRDLMGAMVVERGIELPGTYDPGTDAVVPTDDVVPTDTITGEKSAEVLAANQKAADLQAAADQKAADLQAAADQKAADLQAAADLKAATVAKEIAENLLKSQQNQNKIAKIQLELEKARELAAAGLTDISVDTALQRNLMRDQVLDDEKFLTALEAELGEDASTTDWNMRTEEEVNRRLDELKKKRLEGKSDEVIRLEGELKTLEADRKKLLKSKVVSTDVGTAFVPSIDPDEFSQVVKPVTTVTGTAAAEVDSTGDIGKLTKEQILAEYEAPGSVMKDQPLSGKQFDAAGLDYEDRDGYLMLWQDATKKSAITSGMTKEQIAGGVETGRIMDESLKTVPTTTAQTAVKPTETTVGTAAEDPDLAFEKMVSGYLSDPKNLDLLLEAAGEVRGGEGLAQDVVEGAAGEAGYFDDLTSSMEKRRSSYIEFMTNNYQRAVGNLIKVAGIYQYLVDDPKYGQQEADQRMAAAWAYAEKILPKEVIKSIKTGKVFDTLEALKEKGEDAYVSTEGRMSTEEIAEARGILATGAEGAEALVPQTDRIGAPAVTDTTQAVFDPDKDWYYRSGPTGVEKVNYDTTTAAQDEGDAADQIEAILTTTVTGDEKIGTAGEGGVSMAGVGLPPTTTYKMPPGGLAAEPMEDFAGRGAEHDERGMKEWYDFQARQQKRKAQVAETDAADQTKAVPTTTAVGTVAEEPNLAFEQMVAGYLTDPKNLDLLIDAGKPGTEVREAAKEAGHFEGVSSEKSRRRRYIEFMTNNYQRAVGNLINQARMYQDLVDDPKYGQQEADERMKNAWAFAEKILPKEVIKNIKSGKIFARIKEMQEEGKQTYLAKAGVLSTEDIDLARGILATEPEAIEPAAGTAETVVPRENVAPTLTMQAQGQQDLLAAIVADRKVEKALTDEVIPESVLPVTISKDPYRFGDNDPYGGMGSVGDSPFSMETMHPGQALGHTIPKDLQVTAVIIKGGAGDKAPVVINNVSNSSPTSVNSSSPTTNLNIKAGVNDPHTGKQPNHMHNARRY